MSQSSHSFYYRRRTMKRDFVTNKINRKGQMREIFLFYKTYNNVSMKLLIIIYTY